jgi:hypothetical protein
MGVGSFRCMDVGIDVVKRLGDDGREAFGVGADEDKASHTIRHLLGPL